MNCKPISDKRIEPCYLLPIMKEVRLNFLLHTKQYERLNVLSDKIIINGFGLRSDYFTNRLSIIQYN